MTLAVNDNGNIGGGALIGSDTATITIGAVNDAPVNTVPGGTLAVNAGAALGFTGANMISVHDVDANLASTQLSVLHGTLTVSLAGGASISAGASGSSTLTLSGTETQIDAALATLSYQSALNFSGSDTLTVLSTDSGALTDSDTVAINVAAVNHAPVIQVSETLTRVSVPDSVLLGTVPGTDPLAKDAIAPDMNGEGRFVVFFSSEFAPTQNDNHDRVHGDVFLYDRLTGATTTLTDTQHIPLGLREPGERFSGFSVSGDGNFVVFNGDYTESDQFGSHEVNKVYVYDRNADRVTVLSDPVTHAPIISEGNMPQTNGNGSLITFVRNDNTGVQHLSIYKSDGTLLKDITAANSAVPDNLNNFQNESISNDGGYVSFLGLCAGCQFQSVRTRESVLA